MEPLPFAGFNTKPSPWGYSWTTDSVSYEPTISADYRKSPTGRSNGPRPPPHVNTPAPEPQRQNQYVNMPAALLSSLKKDKKPFTYTPGGVNLPEVLNARLQKRIERKKKNSIGPMSPLPHEHDQGLNLTRVDSPKQVMVMPTYNTPLDMYSMENAIEALEMQAGLTVADNSLSSTSRSATLPRNHTFQFQEKDYDSNRNVAQSKAFKVLQIITDTEEELPANNQASNKHVDEMRFTGIRDKHIPSKFFHQLQRITGTEEEDEEENSTPKKMERMDAPRTTVYDNQQPQRPFAIHHQKYNNQIPNGQNSISFPVQQQNGPILKRPAAFMTAKPFGMDSSPLSKVKSVKPAFLCNGPGRMMFDSSDGTDF